jgi:hypothetical protein
MYKSVIVILFLSVVLMVGCIPVGAPISGSKEVVTQEEAISGFDKVEVSDAFKAEISQGETYSVVVRVDDNLVEYLDVDKQGSTLRIDLKTDRPIRDATLEAEVTLPELTGLDLSGASWGTITGFKSTNSLDANLSGASHLRGDIEAGDTRFSVSGASHVTLGGSAADATVEVSGASSVDLGDFPVVNAIVKTKDASEVAVNASGRLDVDASGASHVYYLGSPTLGKVNTTGASSVESK